VPDVEVDVRLAAGAAAVAELACERDGWRRGEARARLLAEFSAEVNASVADIDHALQLTAERVAEEIGDICSIWLLSEDGIWLDNVALHTTDPAQRAAALLITGRRRQVDREPIATAVVREGVTLFLPDIVPGASPRLLAPEYRGQQDLIPVTSLISAALPARGEVIGTVTIVRSTPGAVAYTRADQAFLEELAARAGVALDNARLYRRAQDAARSLRLSEQRLRAMFDSASVGIAARDPAGVLVECNRAYAAMLGYLPEELIGTPASSVSVPGAAGPGEFADAGGEWEYTYRRRDGSDLHARITASPVRGEDGRLLYRLGLVEDVTDRRRLTEQLRQAQKMEAVGQLAGGVAHDFNNLLTVISGYGQMARQRIGVGPGSEELTEVLHAADRASQLTGQLLAFSRRQRLTPVLLDLNEITKALLPMLRRLIREDIELAMLAQDRLPAVLADRGQIEQIIVNLAVNARDAMPTGGTLTIETQTIELDNAYARTHADVTPGSYACLTVTDTGTGMSPEIMARIFEPFFTTKDLGHGTGLGLATVYGIAAQSGGRIDVYSEPGLGTTFKLALPAQSTAAEPTPAPDTPAAEPARGAETVLLCEDDEPLRQLTERILTTRGYTVLPAARPAEALALAARPGGIDILVTDVIMPDMPGPELAERLWALHPTLRVIFMSGYTAETVGAHANLPQGSAFLQKPFTANTLSAAVRDLLDHPTHTTATPRPVDAT
jgi:two-component system cell cycle sensor histidine kinase/response regulator CckA